MGFVEFGSISHLKKGKKPLRCLDKPQIGYKPYVDIEAFETGSIKHFTNGENCLSCHDGDILIVCDGSRSGFVGIAIEGYVGSTLSIITADGMSNKYLYYFLQGKYPLLNTKMKGTGTPHLDARVLNQQQLFLPTFEEQDRIVAKIEELFSDLDNGVETLKKTKQQLAVYRQTVSKSILDAHCRDAKIVRVGDVCHEVKVGIVIKPTQYYVPSDGVRAFRNGNVRRNFIKDDDWVMISQEGHKQNARSVVHAGDVLIARSGVNLGMASAVPEQFDGYNAIDVVIAVPKQNEVLAQYLAYFTNSPYGISSVKKNQRGVAQGHLNIAVYNKLPLMLPTIKEQKAVLAEIEARLSVCDSIEKTVDAALQQAEAMRQSILKKAFEGGL